MGEVGRATQRNVGQVCSIGLQDTLGSVNIWVDWVAIKVKAMRDCIRVEIARDATKAINREAFIIIVHFQN